MLNNNTGSNRTYRIRTSVGTPNGGDNFVNINLDQDAAVIEMLSLKIDTTNFYKLHTSNYGCIAGRVLANGGVGIPNVKISVFIAVDTNEDDPVIKELYPFANSFSRDGDNVKYNLLPDTQVTVCHTPIGNFPSKRMVLDDENMNTIFTKYYKYTTRTNDSGDYMLFGIPVGEQIIHSDVDLSDIGFLSQKPRDMIYKGYNITQFENANKFKSDVNIDNLVQVFTQDDPVTVYPFWGDEAEGEIKITRNDINIQYKFEPTCVFLGSLITDERSNGITKDCTATDRMGKMDKLTTGSGTIEMIRKTPDGSVEEFYVQGNQLVDGNGTWCYQIPMNLDYYMTDEYGNLVPSDNKEKGIPTRARVRFRLSLNDFQSDYENNHLSKVLIPNNPKDYEDLDYHFGSMTKDDKYGTKSFRDLFWNNVYSVKSYIPRIQKGNGQRNNKFTGIKQVNVNGSNNPIPYNNIRVNLTFMFVLQCAIIKMLIKITGVVNWFKVRSSDDKCSVIGDGVCPDLENWYFAPKCRSRALRTTLEAVKEELDDKSIETNNKPQGSKTTVCVTNQTDYLFQCVEINLAMEYEIIQFDFYNDWINGLVYVPRWFVNKKKKRSYLFGLIRTPARTQACMETTYRLARRYVQQCALSYKKNENNGTYTEVSTPNGCKDNNRQKCHTGYGRKAVPIFKNLGGGGLVHDEQTLRGQSVYYIRPAEWIESNKNDGINTRCTLFATDIILLGSLNENDENSVPNAFEEIVSSTYKMPSNLAATNMDTNAFMYGIGTHGARCAEQYLTTEPLEIIKQDFQNYKTWSRDTDYADSLSDDIYEAPLTESSGIDWGYMGPNQGSGTNFDGGNNLKNLYFPGGHFLGISCTNSQVNIKSCVNLGRICEIGTSISQRQTIPINKDGDNIAYTNIIPTGLINKYDITDSNFRKIFATLNSNGLRTKTNTNNGYLEYDFNVLLPTAFNGELSQKVDNKDYNSDRGISESSIRETSTSYKNIIEKSSLDYYRFKMGEPNENVGYYNKYLIHNNKEVALPMYENSYYFYFGLRDGNTAIDRFFKDFYAPCVTQDEDTGYFTIETTDANYCETRKGQAKITINNVMSPYTISLEKDDPYSYTNKTQYLKLYINNENNCEILVSESSGDNYGTYVTHDYTSFTLMDLGNGVYILTMNTESEGTTSIKFQINNEELDELSATTVDSKDFTEPYYGSPEDERRYPSYINNGCITINNIIGGTTIGYVIATDDYYLILPISGYGTWDDIHKKLQTIINISSMVALPNRGSVSGSATVAAWKGNDTYTVMAITRCGSEKYAYETLANLYISMPTPLDIYFTDEDVTFNNTIEGKVSYTDDRWPYRLFNNNSLSEKQKWCLKQALFYRGSMYNMSLNGDLKVYPYNGNTPYNEVINGKAELLEDGFVWENFLMNLTNEDASIIKIGVNSRPNIALGYECDIHNFYLPTNVNGHKLRLDDFKGYNAVLSFEKIMFNGYSPYYPKCENDYGNYTKMVYKYSVSDNDGTRVPESGEITLPSYYKPFFINAIASDVYRYDSSGGTTSISNLNYSVAVSNLIPYNGDYYGTIKINGKTIVKNGGVVPSQDAGTTRYSSDSLDSDYVFVLSGSTDPMAYGDSDILGLSVEIGEPSPLGNTSNAKTISESIIGVFPSKENTSLMKGMRFYEIDNSREHGYAEKYLGYSGATVDVNNYTGTRIVPSITSATTQSSYNVYYNGIFGIGGDYNLYDVTNNITNAMIYGNGTWDDFVDAVKDVSEKDYDTGYYYLIAIYDPWTAIGIEGGNSDGNGLVERNFEHVYQRITPDTNTLGLARLYLIK